jgi:hypothetical protein
VLNLTGNRIERLPHPFPPLPELRELRLAHNRLSQVT